MPWPDDPVLTPSRLPRLPGRLPPLPPDLPAWVACYLDLDDDNVSEQIRAKLPSMMRSRHAHLIVPLVIDVPPECVARRRSTGAVGIVIGPLVARPGLEFYSVDTQTVKRVGLIEDDAVVRIGLWYPDLPEGTTIARTAEDAHLARRVLGSADEPIDIVPPDDLEVLAYRGRLTPTTVLALLFPERGAA